MFINSFLIVTNRQELFMMTRHVWLLGVGAPSALGVNDLVEFVESSNADGRDA